MYELDKEEAYSAVSLARDSLYETKGDLESSIAEWLYTYSYALINEEEVELKGTIELIGTIQNDKDLLIQRYNLPDDRDYQLRLPEKSYQWCKEFLKQILIRTSLKTISPTQKHLLLRFHHPLLLQCA